MILDFAASIRIFAGVPEQLAGTPYQSNQEAVCQKELNRCHILHSYRLASHIFVSQPSAGERILWQVGAPHPGTTPQCHGLLPELLNIMSYKF